MSYLLEIIIEHKSSRKYNFYRLNMDKNTNISDLLAQGRAIHFAMRNGAITYDEAKIRVQPILVSVNNHIRQIAKRHKVKPRFIRFQDLGRWI